MYSKNKYCRSCRERDADDEMLTPEEEELYRYELPPHYDGSRFSYRARLKTPARQVNETRTETTTKDEASCNTDAQEKTSYDESNAANCGNGNSSELSHLFDGISHEELLIISLILTVAGSEDSGELILFLLILLLRTQ